MPSNINDADDWYSNYPSPDFYHVCGDPIMSVPNNTSGSQSPNTGSAYVGLYAWPLIEYMQVELVDYLIAGHVYEASFVVNMIDNAQYGVNNIGLYVGATDIGPTSVDGELLWTPQISDASGTPMTSTSTWATITGTFVADGSEKFVTIGRFGEVASANLVHPYPTNIWPLAYYVYDDISLVDLTLLPVDLIDLSATQVEDGVEIRWKTLSELNADHFNILRSGDGINYVEIGELQAAGNSQAPRSYSFPDRDVNAEILYYKLEQVDHNGTLHEFGPIAVRMTQPVELFVAPNPCPGDCQVFGYNWPDSSYLRVINASGQQVAVLNGGKSHVILPCLESGLYIVQLWHDGFILGQERIVIGR